MTVETMNDETFEYVPPRITFEENGAGATDDIPEECVNVMDTVVRSLREPGNPNPVFGFNERGALFRLADGDEADEYMLTGVIHDNGDDTIDVSKYVVTVNGKVVYETGYEVNADNINEAHIESIDAFMAALGVAPVK